MQFAEALRTPRPRRVHGARGAERLVLTAEASGAGLTQPELAKAEDGKPRHRHALVVDKYDDPFAERSAKDFKRRGVAYNLQAALLHSASCAAQVARSK